MDTPTIPTRRILATGSTPPKAEILKVEPATGTVLFAWLDATDARIDSGNSLARFAPVSVPPVPPATVGTWAEPDDATLTAAITAVLA